MRKPEWCGFDKLPKCVYLEFGEIEVIEDCLEQYCIYCKGIDKIAEEFYNQHLPKKEGL